MWLAYVWLQLLPLPAEWLNVLSPHAARWHADGAWPAQNLAAPLPRTKPTFVKASCKSIAEPMTFPRVAGVEQGAGGSKDGTMVYWWTVDGTGAHKLKVHIWNGQTNTVVHERNVPAPPVKLAPGADAPNQ